jgi:predicted membrane metal-binding protein
MLNLENCDDIVKDFFLRIDGIKNFDNVTDRANLAGAYRKFVFHLQSIHTLSVTVSSKGEIGFSIFRNDKSEGFKKYISIDQLFYNEEWYKDLIRIYEKEREENGGEFDFESNLKIHFGFLKKMLITNKDIQEVFYGRKWIEQKHHFEYIENFYNEIRQKN